MNAVILHGTLDKEEYYDSSVASASNNHWIPWLRKQLLVNDIEAQTPEIPNAFKPHYPTWKEEFERFDITPQTLLVGHSCGGGFLVRWLSENKDKKVNKVVLVAPWIDVDQEKAPAFFDFTIDPDLANRTAGLTIFNSDDDMEMIQKSVQVLRETVGNHKYQEFHGYEHFTLNDMGTTEFPELLKVLLED